MEPRVPRDAATTPCGASGPGTAESPACGCGCGCEPEAAGSAEASPVGDGWLIVRLSPADGLTLVALAFVCLAAMMAVGGSTAYAIALLMLAMFFDAFDGIVARAYGWESPFGRYLDGFVDALSYLVVPCAIVYRLGAIEHVDLVVYTAFVAAGLMRLSVFNVIGNVKVCGGLAYLGLPVFWSTFLVAFIFGLRQWLPTEAWHFVTPVLMSTMAVSFLLNRPFWKPKNQALIVVAVLGFALLFFWLGSRGMGS